MKRKVLYSLALMFLIVSIGFSFIAIKNYRLNNPNIEELRIIDTDHGSNGSSSIAYHKTTRRMFVIISDNKEGAAEIHKKIDKEGHHQEFSGTTTTVVR